MATCSICEQPEAAALINELLSEGKTLDEISAQVGQHRSSIFRHRKRCYRTWLAAKVRARKTRNDGTPARTVVQWPDGLLVDLYRQETIYALRPDDVIFCVELAKPLPPRIEPVEDAVKLDGIPAGPNGNRP